MSNVNLETGIRFGVIHPSAELMDKIITHGVDESFEAYKEQLTRKVANAIESALDDYVRSDYAMELAQETAESMVDDMEHDDYQCDETEYSYTDKDGNWFRLSWLGGAPLLWCIKTSKIVRVNRLCSPCVPNAGDIDSGIVAEDDQGGFECYGLPDDYAELQTANW